MKKLAVLLVAIVAVFGVAKADDDRPIVVSKLPAKAQTFLKQYFKTSEVALAKEDRDLFSSTYDVIFTDGGKVEFEGNGNWKEVKCKNVPTAIVPKPIYNFLTKNYMKQGVTIVKIERDKRGYDVKLSSGMELEFDTNYNLVDIDD